jgi:HAD superfamily hydrolase (TIGR01549 family)
VLFDLDGTLLDSFQSHLEVYRATLARFGIPLDGERFRRLYTPDWNDFYRRVGLPREHWEAASAVWLEAAAAHHPRPFTGVRDALERLRGRFRLGIVTAGSRTRVRADLERGALAGFFQVVVTADDVREPKPAPEGLHLALRSLGLAAGRALYVGDTGADYDFARAAGVTVVAVTSAFAAPRRRERFRRLDAVTDLPGYLAVA